MDAATAQLYGVLLMQGSLWVLGHCPGMCGPLVAALRFPGARSLLAYQAGKAVTYALLGALETIAPGNGLAIIEETESGVKDPPNKALSEAIRAAGMEAVDVRTWYQAKPAAYRASHLPGKTVLPQRLK